MIDEMNIYIDELLADVSYLNEMNGIDYHGCNFCRTAVNCQILMKSIYINFDSSKHQV